MKRTQHRYQFRDKTASFTGEHKDLDTIDDILNYEHQLLIVEVPFPKKRS